MTAAFVTRQETWPEPGEFDLSIDNIDGEFARALEDGGAEVVIHEPTDKPLGERVLIIPLRFATLEQGERAAAALNEVFQRVREIQGEEALEPEACEHRTRLVRFARVLKQTIVCELCGKHLGTVDSRERTPA